MQAWSMTREGGFLIISIDGDDQIGAKIKTLKDPWASNKTSAENVSQ